jgi:uncharacterized protein (TIGR00369 family)
MTFQVEATPEGIQRLLDSSPFTKFLNLAVVSLDVAGAKVALKMPMRPELQRAGGRGQFQGGPIASLIDTAGDYALIASLRVPVPTINLRIDYLRPATGEYLIASASVRRAGKTVGVVDIDVTDPQGNLCAVGRGCYGTTAG